MEILHPLAFASCMQGNFCEAMVEQAEVVPSQNANHEQTSGCVTAPAAVTSEGEYSKFATIQVCPVDLETLNLFRARKWVVFWYLMIQRLLEKKINAHKLAVAYLTRKKQKMCWELCTRWIKLKEEHRQNLCSRKSPSL